MLKDILTKITGGGIVKKFIIWTVIIIILLDVLTAIVMEIDLNKTLSEDLNERGQTLSKHLALESGGGEPLSNDGMVNLQKIVENMKKAENDVKYVYITDTEGKVIAHTFEGAFPVELLAANNDTGSSPRLLNTGQGYVTEFSAPIPGGTGGFVHIGMDRTSINEKITRTTYIIIVNILIEGGLGIMMAFIAGNYLARPIRSLVKGAEEIGRGNLGYQIEAGSTDDEIHTLSNAFNKMSYNLNKSISELRTSEERYRNLVDGISDAVFLIDSQKRILSWNIAAQGIFGWTSKEVAGKKIDILFSSPISTTDDQPDGEILFIKKDGSPFPGVVRTKPLQEGGYVMVIRDITDQKEMEKLEKQLLQSDKLATVGQLAAGIAHEINNPLGNISLYTQMLLKKATDENIKDKLVVINDEANRAAKIVKGLLDFARQSEPELSPLDINKEIGKVIGMLNLQLKDLSIQNPRLKDIRVTTDLGPLPLILADGGQIRQVIMNLLTNSIQSISKDGEIMVKTVAKEGFVEMSISDNGYGIPKENLTKIFDPFFTTKEHGKGTGLGLSVSYGIIKRHNGSIEVESEVGKGTTVKIKLPA